MLSQYFAQYLLNNNLLSADKVKLLLEEEHEHRVKLGVLAINKGFMTAAQVEFVHQLQVRFDKRFGEVAVNEGLLTDEQLEILLTTQENGNLNFGQAIVDKKFMTLEELEQALIGYNGNNQLAVNRAVNQIEITKIDFSEIDEVKELYGEYVDLFLRSLVRFMDTSGVVLHKNKEIKGNHWLISQRMVGQLGLTAGLLLSEEVLLEMAKRYSGEEITTVDELAVDSVSEFLNVTNGIFIVNLSNRRIDIDLEPQKHGKNIQPTGSKQAIIPIDTNLGEINLVLAADEMQ